MSLVEAFKFVVDTISDFVNSDISGIIFLGFFAIPLSILALRSVLNLIPDRRVIYDDNEEKKGND